MAFGFMAIHRQEWLVDEMITLAKGVKKNNNSKIEEDILLYKQSLLELAKDISKYVSFEMIKKDKYSCIKIEDFILTGYEGVIIAAKYYIPNPVSRFKTYAEYLVRSRICKTAYASSSKAFKMHRDSLCYYESIERIYSYFNGHSIIETTDYKDCDDEFLSILIKREKLISAILLLTQDESFILLHLYALFNYDKMTVSKLSSILKISPAKVFRTAVKAKEKVKSIILANNDLLLN